MEKTFNISVFFTGQGSKLEQGFCKDLFQNTLFKSTKLGSIPSYISQTPKVFDYLTKTYEESPVTLDNSINQPALYSHGVMTFELLKNKLETLSLNSKSNSKSNLPKLNFNFTTLGGHSLGEYIGLCGSNLVKFSDGFNLVQKRGRLMEDFRELITDEKEKQMIKNLSMLAIMDTDFQRAQDIKQEILSLQKDKNKEDIFLEITNINSDTQIVYSGDKDILQQIVDKKDYFGLRIAVILAVNIPFHSRLMKPVADKFLDSINQVFDKNWNGKSYLSPNENKVNFLSNYTGKIVDLKSQEELKNNLYQQTFNGVRWDKCMKTCCDIYADMEKNKKENTKNIVLEIGASSIPVLTGLIKGLEYENKKYVDEMFLINGEKEIDQLIEEIILKE